MRTTMDKKYEVIQSELRAIFAGCESEIQILETRHQIYDVFSDAASARLREVFKTEFESAFGKMSKDDEAMAEIQSMEGTIGDEETAARAR
jgi:hypothetical protein